LVSKLANLFNGGHILAEDDSVHGLQLAGWLLFSSLSLSLSKI
jgi:hypothetical protein